jgi:phosphoesterase RecJ-like protein
MYGRFVLTTHRDPDGDGLGAEAALARALRRMGKRVSVVNDGRLPEQYAFLGSQRLFQRYRPSEHNRLIEAADAVIVVDAGTPARTGRLAKALSDFEGARIVIDHHPGGGWGSIEVIDEDAVSTTQLVACLLDMLDVDVTPAMADALYAGILADTNGFSNTNTSAVALRTAATLVERGARPSNVFQGMFASWPVDRLRLQGDVLARLQTAEHGRIVWGTVRRDSLRRFRQPTSATEGFVELALATRGTELAIHFIEEPRDFVRLSIRSRAPVRADQIAKAFEGGGHALAAGARVRGSLESVRRRVLPVARAALGKRASSQLPHARSAGA